MIYLSGPISLGGKVSEKQKELYKQVFKEAKTVLEYKGHLVVSPISLEIKNGTWFDYMAICLNNVAKVEAVVVLPDFEKSIGSIKEVEFALLLGKPIFRLDEFK